MTDETGEFEQPAIAGTTGNIVDRTMETVFTTGMTTNPDSSPVCPECGSDDIAEDPHIAPDIACCSCGIEFMDPRRIPRGTR